MAHLSLSGLFFSLIFNFSNHHTMFQSLILKSILCIIICVTLGSVSGILSGSGMTDWYQNLNKPFFQPPSWVFGPAWTILYTLMGIAIARIWHQPDSSLKSRAIRIFISQFVLNLIWTPIFFALKQPLIALIIIIMLWILILLTIRSFKKVNPLSAILLIPYILWVSFATILNGSIVYLN